MIKEGRLGRTWLGFCGRQQSGLVQAIGKISGIFRRCKVSRMTWREEQAGDSKDSPRLICPKAFKDMVCDLC